MSPEVWTDVRARLAAAARSAGLFVEWPNETGADRPSPPAPWVSVEVAAEATAPIEIGIGTWQENGSVWLSIMVPTGSGIETGLALRKGLSTAFRDPADVTTGLVYRDGQTFDPLERAGTDDGVYARLTLVIRYIYQDRLT